MNTPLHSIKEHIEDSLIENIEVSIHDIYTLINFYIEIERIHIKKAFQKGKDTANNIFSISSSRYYKDSYYNKFDKK